MYNYTLFTPQDYEQYKKDLWQNYYYKIDYILSYFNIPPDDTRWLILYIMKKRQLGVTTSISREYITNPIVDDEIIEYDKGKYAFKPCVYVRCNDNKMRDFEKSFFGDKTKYIVEGKSTRTVYEIYKGKKILRVFCCFLSRESTKGVPLDFFQGQKETFIFFDEMNEKSMTNDMYENFKNTFISVVGNQKNNRRKIFMIGVGNKLLTQPDFLVRQGFYLNYNKEKTIFQTKEDENSIICFVDHCGADFDYMPDTVKINSILDDDRNANAEYLNPDLCLIPYRPTRRDGNSLIRCDKVYKVIVYYDNSECNPCHVIFKTFNGFCNIYTNADVNLNNLYESKKFNTSEITNEDIIFLDFISANRNKQQFNAMKVKKFCTDLAKEYERGVVRYDTFEIRDVLDALASKSLQAEYCM